MTATPRNAIVAVLAALRGAGRRRRRGPPGVGDLLGVRAAHPRPGRGRRRRGAAAGRPLPRGAVLRAPITEEHRARRRSHALDADPPQPGRCRRDGPAVRDPGDLAAAGSRRAVAHRRRRADRASPRLLRIDPQPLPWRVAVAVVLSPSPGSPSTPCRRGALLGVACRRCRAPATGSTRPPPTCAILDQPPAARAPPLQALRDRLVALAPAVPATPGSPDDPASHELGRRAQRLTPAEIDRILTRIEEPVTDADTAPMSVAEAAPALADRVLDEVERAVVGKRDALTLVLAAVLAKGHVLLEDFPGLGKTLAARSFARRPGPGLRARPVHPRPAAGRPHRLVHLRPAPGGVRVPPGPAVHRAAAGRRDQPHPAQDPVGAAGGDAGAPGHRRGRDLPAAQPRSTCSPPPTRSSTRAPTRCPRRSSTGSCCASRFGYPTSSEEYDVLSRRLDRQQRGGRRSSRSPTRPGCWPCRRPSRRVAVDESVGRYCVDLAAATRSHPDVLTGASPRGSLGLVLDRARLGGRSAAATT